MLLVLSVILSIQYLKEIYIYRCKYPNFELRRKTPMCHISPKFSNRDLAPGFSPIKIACLKYLEQPDLNLDLDPQISK